MIAPGDAVLALSNSGDTAELSDIVAHSRRFRIPLVAMTRREASTLPKPPMSRWFCQHGRGLPDGLTPTTSTTMMLL